MVSMRKNFLKATGEVIAKKRKKKNISQEELGQVLNVSHATVSRYETGSIEIPSSALPVVSEACGFPMWAYVKAWESVSLFNELKEAVSIYTETPEDKEIEYIVSNSSDVEKEHLSDLCLLINGSDDQTFKQDVFEFMITRHIRESDNEATKKRVLCYYERLLAMTKKDIV